MQTRPLLVLAALLGALTATTPALADDLPQVRAAIAAAGAGWEAGPTSVSALPPEQRAGLAGALPSGPAPGDYVFGGTDRGGLPSSWDWRDQGGNWMSPIRAQGGCGSCWAFAAIGAMEARHNINAGDPSWDPDLSEQIVLSCSNGTCGGWYIDGTLEYLLYHGTQHESCMPYQESDWIPCNDACADHVSQPWKITHWHWVSNSVNAMKEEIIEAPIVAWMNIYEDFSYYKGGVYEHVWGGSYGGHFVVIVGWNDAEQCWIAKNSWGEWWGEDTYGVTGHAGWFRIKWGASGIADWEPTALDVPGCSCPDSDGDGFAPADCVDPLCPEVGDCDDGDPTAHPGASEDPCDGVDNDCDGQLHPDEADADGDGWTICDGDCHDGEASVHPDHEEICGDDLDNDCDGMLDDGDVCGGDDDDGDDDDASGGAPGQHYLENSRDGCQCERAGGVVVSWAPWLLLPLLGLRRRARRG